MFYKGLQNLLGPSYWYCEQIVALLATQAAVPSPASDLENRRRLCLEMQLHMEFAWQSSAATVPAAPPALLLLAPWMLAASQPLSLGPRTVARKTDP